MFIELNTGELLNFSRITKIEFLEKEVKYYLANGAEPKVEKFDTNELVNQRKEALKKRLID